MLKILIKKELKKLWASLSSARTSSGKKKKARKQGSGKGSKILMLCLWIFIFLALGMAFAGMSAMLSDALLSLEMDWLYFVLVGIAGLLLSIIGNSFTAYSTIYKAKDNDLLLSMPVPVRYILISRFTLIFFYSVLYTAIYMIPSFIMRALWRESVSAVEIICLILMIVIMAVFVTALSAALGWVLAQIAKHIRNKAAATTVFTLVFLAAYYYFYFNINTYLQKLTMAAAGIGEAVESSVLGVPLIHFGKALCGSFVSVFIWLAIAAVLAAVVFRVLDRSFINIATKTEKTAVVKYSETKQEQVQLQSPKKALLRKELRRFIASPTYMINCGLGILVAIAAAVMIFVKRADIAVLLDLAQELFPEFESLKVLLISAVIFMIFSMIDISAPSISMEGKNLWILKAFPVRASDVFFAKTNLQILFSLPPLVLLLAAIAIVFKPLVSEMLFIAVFALLYIRLHSQMGVFLGLMFPKLDWTNEAVPVKQSLAVVLSMFAGFIFVLVAAALYWFVVRKFTDAQGMMIGLMMAMAVATKLFDRWFAGRGTERFETL